MTSIRAILIEGHKVASGIASDSPYPKGSISMQAPFFKRHGVNIDSFHHATLNLSISPNKFKLFLPEFTVHDLQWAEGFPAEDFSFSQCEIIFNDTEFKGLVYYPHPETKIGHFHNDSIIEIITYYVPNIHYGDEVTLKLNSAEISIQ